MPACYDDLFQKATPRWIQQQPHSKFAFDGRVVPGGNMKANRSNGFGER